MALTKRKKPDFKTIIALFIGGWIFLQGIWAVFNYAKIKRERQKLEREVALLKARIAVLEREEEFLNSREGIKTLARLRLGLKNEGERLIYIVNEGEEGQN